MDRYSVSDVKKDEMKKAKAPPKRGGIFGPDQSKISAAFALYRRDKANIPPGLKAEERVIILADVIDKLIEWLAAAFQ